MELDTSMREPAEFACPPVRSQEGRMPLSLGMLMIRPDELTCSSWREQGETGVRAACDERAQHRGFLVAPIALSSAFRCAFSMTG